MAIRIFQVDAFCEKPFTGNPACVCLMQDEKPDSWLQAVAAEMNLSETAFLWPRENRYQIRWFTPACEANLCGHATLASAHVVWEAKLVDPSSTIEFDSRGGPLKAEKMGDQIILDFPAKVINDESSAPDGLLDSLNAEPLYLGTDGTDYLLEVASEREVLDLTPDFTKLANVNARGVIVTARSDRANIDFVSRFFGPKVGIDEDPVTGSAHCLLAPYWAEKLNKNELKAHQASNRGGFLDVELFKKRVFLGGKATTIFRGELLV
ncbi:MAG: PhzF family phenazine biosynthesis protein [Planctomycetota bacterium]